MVHLGGAEPPKLDNKGGGGGLEPLKLDNRGGARAP